MAITIIQQPPLISPVFAENKYWFFETGAEYFTLTFSGDVSGTFKILPNSEGIAEFDARYVLENYVSSQIALPSWLTLPNGMITYSLSVVSSLSSTASVLSQKVFNGALQDRESITFTSGDVLNNTEGGLTIHRDDELTLQMISGSDISVINASTSAQSVPSYVNKYTVAGVEITIIEEHPKFEPYRFAYVNQNGATDYVNFSLADKEKLKISKDYYENDNKNILYNVEVGQSFTVHSEAMSEIESKKLRYFWISPKIELIKDGKHYPVNISATSVEVQNRESGVIFYSVTFNHESKFNVQK